VLITAASMCVYIYISVKGFVVQIDDHEMKHEITDKLDTNIFISCKHSKVYGLTLV